MRFKEECLNRLKAAEVYICEYRNQYVQHLNTGVDRETKGTIHNMRGDVQFVGRRPSSTPKELGFVVNGVVKTMKKFICGNLNLI